MKRYRKNHLSALIVGLWLISITIQAHPITTAKCHALITTNEVSVAISVYPESFYYFGDLEMDEEPVAKGSAIKKAIESHKEFLLKYFTIENVSTQKLAGTIVSVDSSKAAETGISLDEMLAAEDDPTVYLISYPLKSPPHVLVMYQDFGGEDWMFPSMMELTVQQEGLPDGKMEVLDRGVPKVVGFNWVQGVGDKELTKKELEKLQSDALERALGIASHGGVYSFIYIADAEVRHEILLPLRTLETWQPIARKDNQILEIAEQVAAKEVVREFFNGMNPVTIDGIEVQPVLQRLDFYDIDTRDLALQMEPKRLRAMMTRVGIILSYSTKGPPDEITVDWTMFDDSLWKLQSVAVFEDESRKHVFEVGAPPFKWTREGKKARAKVEEVAVVAPQASSALVVSILAALCAVVATVVLAVKRSPAKRYLLPVLFVIVALAAMPVIRERIGGVASMSEDEAGAIFTALHRNVYRAFDYSEESDIYDVLARSVDGELLEDLYLQIRRALVIREQGGAVSRIRKVDILQGDMASLDGEGFAYRCKWLVEGTVEHWGHIHTRQNQYEGLFQIRPRDDAWRIVGLKMLSEERVGSKISLRRF